MKKYIRKVTRVGKRSLSVVIPAEIVKELNELVENGLFVYDIQKIRNFICYKKQINLKI